MRRFGRVIGALSVGLTWACAAASPAEPATAQAAPVARAVAAARAEPAQAAAPPEAIPTLAADRQRSLRDSTLLAQLEKVGLKPGALPQLADLSARQRLPVMAAFSAALGVKCTGCHVSEQEFTADTRNKQLTRHMWDELVVPLRLNGKQVFCDSCHQGNDEILHRADPASVTAFMKLELAGRLTSASGPTTCETCHGAPFEPHLFLKRWGVKG